MSEPQHASSTDEQQNKSIDKLTRRIDVLSLGQLLLGVAAFMVSGAALWASFTQADATRQMQYSSALPVIQLDFSMEPLDKKTYNGRISVANVGVGVARIKSWSVEANGESLSPGTFEASLPPVAVVTNFGGASMENRSLAPGSAINAFTFQLSAESVSPMIQAFGAQETRIEMNICYCSVFDQCWTARQKVGQENSSAEPVKTCTTAAETSAPE